MFTVAGAGHQEMVILIAEGALEAARELHALEELGGDAEVGHGVGGGGEIAVVAAEHLGTCVTELGTELGVGPGGT